MIKKCDSLVVLAAGMSSRMKKNDPEAQLNSADLQQANNITKSLISIGAKGQVLLDYVLFNAKKAGFKSIYLVTGENNTLFKNHYKNHQLGLDIHFAIQHLPPNRKKPLGTADAIVQMLDQYPKLKNQNFVVCNSDNLYSIKAFKALRNCTKNQALISYERNTLKFSEKRIAKFAVLSIYQNKVRGIVEKPDSKQMASFFDEEGKIRVSMNLFKLSGILIYPFVKNCPLHPIRQEKELPVAINNFLKTHPLSMQAIPLSEHVPDLTSKKDIVTLREQLKDFKMYK